MGVKVRERNGTYRILIVGIFTLLISTSLAITAYSGQLEDALTAYNRKEYATAYRLFKPLAERGSPKAQFFLGVMYNNGEGVPQDYAEAVKWYRKASEQGNAVAQVNLGVMYENGQGVPQDYTEAAKWYRKASEQGNAFAQSNLGLMYDNGQGVPQDYTEAVKWYRKASEQGNAVAQVNLGVSYDEGKGVPQNYVLAHMWLNIAASRLPPSEGGYRDMAVRKRDLVASKMTPAQIAEAQRLASEWKPKKEGK